VSTAEAPETPAASPVALTREGESLLFPALPYSIHGRSERASRDPVLQQFVGHATISKDLKRRAACEAAFGDRYDRVRELAGRIKQHTLDHLDHYLERWITQAEAAGVRVHVAEDAAEANRICVRIAEEAGAKLCVKSKSMVTEETHLVPELERIGCQTIETDLGEFILQLDHDAPSHIVTPMIHKDRTAVARAFVRELGAEYTEDAGALTGIARRHLRQKYRQADLGISGGNFLVAETGSVAICTNEGNGRFCTSAPPIHVAMVGIEKLVPDLEGLSVLLKLLARSATGQPLTCYTHLMTGPRRAGEPDGPEAMHVILVDNGRSGILDESVREMLRCIRCGACLNACPVYRKVGGHAYGAVYSGPIGAILTPMLKGLANYPDLAEASSLCGACFEACPVKIDIPRQLIRLRERKVDAQLGSAGDRFFYRAWAASVRHPATYRLGGWLQKTAFRARARMAGTLERGDPYLDRGWLSAAPGPVAGWTRERDLPTPPAASFRTWWRRRGKPGGMTP